nr:MFS transporter [Saccharopolyspora sp. HNM0983]
MSFALLGRLHTPAVPLVVTFLVADWTGSYAISGLAVAATTLAHAVAGPLRGRAADRGSAPVLLLVTGAAYALGSLALVGLVVAADPSWWWVLVPLGLITGLCTPPVAQLGRAVWPRIARGRAVEAAYAVEATLQELLFVLAPLLAASAIALFGPVVAMLGCAVFSAAGPAAFAWALHRADVGAGPERPVVGTGSGLLRAGGFPALLGFAALLVGGLTVVDLLIVGWARDRGAPALAGLLAAVWAMGSLVGGLLAGGLPGRPRLLRRAVLAALGVCALVPVLPPVADAPVSLAGAVLFAGGAAIAPTLAAANGRVAELAPEHARSEAFGWFAAATTLGSGLAAPVAGALLDTSGPAGAAAVAAGALLIGVGLVAHHNARSSRSAPAADQTAVT